MSNTLTSGSLRRQYLKCSAECGFTAKDSFRVDQDGKRITEFDRLTASIERLTRENEQMADRMEHLETLVQSLLADP
ncbi:hypothetical protein [Stieleria mannarensis]|uniref:hypothetical protein n=1 Tax=Stieleria mannarensis TaxID=2755585 RepID=UPI0015FF518C|nr:hypothetical protein [Rhodopirellula sp. JC639]